MSKTVAYFGMAMSLFFIFMGLLLPFKRPPILEGLGMHDVGFYILGFILLAYGIFRFWRAYKMLKH